MYFKYSLDGTCTAAEPPGGADYQRFKCERLVLTLLHQNGLIGPNNHMGLSIDQ